MKSDTQRMFTAIMPDDVLSAELKKKINMLKLESWADDVRWIPVDNLHVTVVFLGDVPVNRAGLMSDEFQQACSLIRPFEITLSTVIMMPSSIKPRVIAVELLENSDLKHVVESIKHKAEPYGFKPEKRPFRGHITIGRFRKNNKIRKLEIDEALNPVMMHVSRIQIMTSVLKQTGADYSIYREIILNDD